MVVVVGAVVVVGVVSVDVVSVDVVSVVVVSAVVVSAIVEFVVVSDGVSLPAPTAPPATAPPSRTAPSAASAAIFVPMVQTTRSCTHSLDHRAFEVMGRPTHLRQALELPSHKQHCVHEPSGAEPNGIVGRKAGVRLGGRDRRPRAILV